MTLATTRMAATTRRYTPVSARALFLRSMAFSLCPLPPLERPEGRHQTAQADREEVDDVPRDDLAAREGRQPGVEADEGDDVAEERARRPLHQHAHEAEHHEEDPGDEEGDDL